MSLRCLVIGDCRRVALPAIFCLTSLISLLFTITYVNDRALLHEAEIRAQSWQRLASRRLDKPSADLHSTLISAAKDAQVDGAVILSAEGNPLAGIGRKAAAEDRNRALDHVLRTRRTTAWLAAPSDDTHVDAMVVVDMEDAIPGAHAALLTIDVSAAQSHYWANAGWHLIGLTVLLVITSGVQGSTCILNLRRLRLARNQIEHVAHHDALTGLPNRLLFQERLHQSLADAELGGAQLGVLLLDLDRFKMVNDTLGHPAGDALLQQVGKRLNGLHRAGDVVARLGGDEFALLLRGLNSPDQAMTVSRRIVEALAEPFALEGRQVNSAASVGIALYPQDGSKPDELLAKADMALYRAKADGRSRTARFEPAMQAGIEEDQRIEDDLRSALAKDQFRLVYQPQIDLATGSTMGVEALLRWRHDDRGLLDPGDFLRIAEEAGLMREIGTLVLDRACRQMRRWLDDGIDLGKLAVNLSPSQLADKAIVETILNNLERYDLDPTRLVLEITEGCVIGPRSGEATSVLAELRAAGIALALDDFGTGYASLSHLKSLPVSQLKIDRSFVQNSIVDGHSAAIVQAIISLAHDLGLEVVAEGVELPEQLALLKQLGCDHGQGYIFARPMQADEMSSFARAIRPDSMVKPARSQMGPGHHGAAALALVEN